MTVLKGKEQRFGKGAAYLPPDYLPNGRERMRGPWKSKRDVKCTRNQHNYGTNYGLAQSSICQQYHEKNMLDAGRALKGLSHEIDFKNIDKNLQNLA